MRVGYKKALYTFAGFVFFLFALAFAKTIELWNKYQKASDLLLVCEAKQIATINDNKELLERLDAFEASMKESEKYRKVLEQLGLRIDSQDIGSETEKESFKDFLKNKYE
ncbi:hypothetical protein [Helicobacter himalayensis]|uniref:hypothetical protein n=1 Tax=Helicobacter himalayensis TaxID=1591088 RepID=UPI00082D81A4|nr:hypothetical protein [Helicobacter himalayensis]